MTTQPWLLVTAEQLKQGWIEMRGVTPIHHEFIVIETILNEHDGGRPVYKVRSPELQLLEKQ
jgi:hypothetical protein